MGVRKLMDFIFSPIEMYWLDHMLPGEERIKREDLQVAEQIFSASVSLVVISYLRALTSVSTTKRNANVHCEGP